MNTFPYISSIQNSLYENIRNSDPNIGRLKAIPICFADIILETFKYPLSSIENLVSTPYYLGKSIYHIIEVPFSKDEKLPEVFCNLKATIQCAEEFFAYLVLTPVAVVSSPFKVSYQLLSTMLYPEKAQSWSNYSEIQKDEELSEV